METHMSVSRDRRLLLTAMAAWAVGIPRAQAQTPSWPSKPVRIIVSNPPGGSVDIYTRTLANELATAMGQSVIVENRTGAGGVIAVKAAAQDREGHTLVYINSGMLTLQAMSGKLDLLKELRPVARLSHSPMALVVRADSPYRSIADLLKAVKTTPGKLTYGSSGNGSPPHLSMALLADKLDGFSPVHVPYKGAVESTLAVVKGEIDFAVGVVGPMLPLLQAGRIRTLAVTSGKRVSLMPDVPTLAESGAADFRLEPWGGLAMAAGAPDAALQRLGELLPAVLASAPLRQASERLASVDDYLPARDFRAQIARDLEVDKLLVKQLGLKEE